MSTFEQSGPRCGRHRLWRIGLVPSLASTRRATCNRARNDPADASHYALGIVITFPAAVPALPYRDAELYVIDQWLGFDRRAYVDLVRHQAWLVTAVNIVYQTMQPQLALVPLALFLAGRLGRLQRFEPQ